MTFKPKYKKNLYNFCLFGQVLTAPLRNHISPGDVVHDRLQRLNLFCDHQSYMARTSGSRAHTFLLAFLLL